MFDRILKKLGLKNDRREPVENPYLPGQPVIVDWEPGHAFDDAFRDAEAIYSKAEQEAAKAAEEAQRNLIKECVREVLNEEKVANSIASEGRAHD